MDRCRDGQLTVQNGSNRYRKLRLLTATKLGKFPLEGTTDMVLGITCRVFGERNITALGREHGVQQIVWRARRH